MHYCKCDSGPCRLTEPRQRQFCSLAFSRRFLVLVSPISFFTLVYSKLDRYPRSSRRRSSSQWSVERYIDPSIHSLRIGAAAAQTPRRAQTPFRSIIFGSTLGPRHSLSRNHLIDLGSLCSTTITPDTPFDRISVALGSGKGQATSKL